MTKKHLKVFFFKFVLVFAFFFFLDPLVELVTQFVDKGFSVCSRHHRPQVSFFEALTNY